MTVDDLLATDPFRGGPLEKFYYQINYRKYPAEQASRLRTFSESEVRRAASLIAQVGSVLTQPATAYQPSSQRTLQFLHGSGDVARLVLTSAGGSAIRELSLRVRDTSEAALRRAQLTLSFDGEAPIVAPLGDFFAGGPGLSPYVGLPLEAHYYARPRAEETAATTH